MILTLLLALVTLAVTVLPVAITGIIRTHQGIVGELAPVIGRMPGDLDNDLDTGES